MVGAMGLDQRNPLGRHRRGAADGGGAPGLGDLDRRQPHAARRAENQNRIAGRDPRADNKRDIRGEIGRHHPGAGDEIDLFRQRPAPLFRHHAPLGIGAEGIDGRDPVAGFDVAHIGSHRRHHARASRPGTNGVSGFTW